LPLNYAEVWSPELLAIKIQETLTSPFIVPNVKWLGAQTFHFTQMSTSGFKPHNRAGGWNRGTVTQTDNEFQVKFSRNIEFLIDKADVDETNATASIENIAKVFQMTQVAPEHDAYFFSKVAQEAIEANLYSQTAASDYTVDNVFTKLKQQLARVKRYRRSNIMYVASWIMDLLELSKELTKKVELTQVADGGIGIETRVTFIDGVPILECIEEDRFYDKFNFNPQPGGFEPIEGGENPSRKINTLIASTEMVITVPKISSIYYFEPGTHTAGDGWLYQHREDYDTFVFPNGKNNQIDSVFVDVVPSVPPANGTDNGAGGGNST
jgi:hypothetical protein